MSPVHQNQPFQCLVLHVVLSNLCWFRLTVMDELHLPSVQSSVMLLCCLQWAAFGPCGVSGPVWASLGLNCVLLVVCQSRASTDLQDTFSLLPLRSFVGGQGRQSDQMCAPVPLQGHSWTDVCGYLSLSLGHESFSELCLSLAALLAHCFGRTPLDLQESMVTGYRVPAKSLPVFCKRGLVAAQDGGTKSAEESWGWEPC